MRLRDMNDKVSAYCNKYLSVIMATEIDFAVKLPLQQGLSHAPAITVRSTLSCEYECIQLRYGLRMKALSCTKYLTGWNK